MIYKYEGPIYHFEQIVINNFVSYTTANSPAKAKNNFLSKAKKQLKLSQSSKLSLKDKYMKCGNGFSKL